MPNLDHAMRRLAIQASTHFDISHPEYYIHPNNEPLDAVELVVHDAGETLRRGATEDGLRLSCWAPFLLATVIGYDGYIVEGHGETLATHLAKSVATPNDCDFVRVGEELGIHRPEQYLTVGSPSERAVDLWGQAMYQVAHGTRPFGLKLAFWAAYVRATEFAAAAADFAEPVAGAASRFRTFANGRS
ncbi:hypothetical protein [Microbacterium sp.]|uniref:hypothetical protein n=1 Tax=Microbacterium sp. TaxID=51671 RepID=UPI002733B49B|nr:hypothetical protein [Microbacterium sp.]MDP3951889.1 hypothetical protein [Microbacterium sp.]